MIPTSWPKRIAILFATVWFFASCAGSREYGHYRWNGKVATPNQEASAEFLRTNSQTGHDSISSSPKQQTLSGGLSTKTPASIQILSQTEMPGGVPKTQNGVWRDSKLNPRFAFSGLQALRFQSQWQKSTKPFQSFGMEGQKEAQYIDSMLLWMLVFLGLALATLLVAGIISSGSSPLGSVFWVIGSVLLLIALIFGVIYLIGLL